MHRDLDGSVVLPAGGVLGDARGWTRVSRRTVPESPWDLTARQWLVEVEVDGTDAWAGAVELLRRGVAIRVFTEWVGVAVLELFDDFTRLGSIHPAATGVFDLLGTDWLPLLEQLGRGVGTAAMARGSNCSVRTLHRRLKALQSALDVDSTEACVAAYRAWLAATG